MRSLFALLCVAIGCDVHALEVRIDAPSSLASAAARVERLDLPQLEEALVRAGLAVPDRIDAVLIPESDPRARRLPRWIVGFAAGDRDIAIFPERVVSYPYESLESVVRHEIVHVALTRTAAGRPLPRWFHEGVAVVIDAGWDMSGRLQLLLAMRAQHSVADLGRLFGSGTQPDSALAYRLSAALVDDLRRRHGAGAVGAIAHRVAGGVTFETAFRETTGRMPDAAAARAWEGYRRWTVWVSALTSPAMPWVLVVLLAFAAFIATRRRRLRRRHRWEEEEFPIPPR